MLLCLPRFSFKMEGLILPAANLVVGYQSLTIRPLLNFLSWSELPLPRSYYILGQFTFNSWSKSLTPTNEKSAGPSQFQRPLQSSHWDSVRAQFLLSISDYFPSLHQCWFQEYFLVSLRYANVLLQSISQKIQPMRTSIH